MLFIMGNMNATKTIFKQPTFFFYIIGNSKPFLCVSKVDKWRVYIASEHVGLIWQCISKFSEDLPLIDYISNFTKKRDDIVIKSNVSDQTFSFSNEELIRHLNYILMITTLSNTDLCPLNSSDLIRIDGIKKTLKENLLEY